MFYAQQALLIEGHYGSEWRRIDRFDDLNDAFDNYSSLVHARPGRPIRLVEADSRLTVAMHDPRRDYSYSSRVREQMDPA